jgi:TonB family protein
MPLLCFQCFGQMRDKTSLPKLFNDLARDEKRLADCDKKRRQNQLAEFGKVLPPISGHCWGGCATRLVKPYYPMEAKRLNISGQVIVDSVVDENGNVVYAKVRKGPMMLRQPSIQAAYFATYTPKIACDGQPIKFRWTITYNFRP